MRVRKERTRQVAVRDAAKDRGVSRSGSNQTFDVSQLGKEQDQGNRWIWEHRTWVCVNAGLINMEDCVSARKRESCLV